MTPGAEVVTEESTGGALDVEVALREVSPAGPADD
jgi:hypothetical protein